MAEADLRIRLECPQCGGAVLLEEQEPLLRCPHCRVRLLLPDEESFPLVLPARGSPEGERFLVPYWRFHGQIYSCGPLGARGEGFDRSLPAVDLPGIPPSLGIRPQALPLLPFGPATPGVALRPTLTRDEAIRRAIVPIEAAGDPEPVHRAYVGETTRLVYFPVEVRGGLRDAVADRPLAPLPPGGIDLSSLADPAPRPVLRFLPPLCPDCGGDLDAEGKSLVLLCGHCRSAWRAERSSLRRIEATSLPCASPPSRRLPFWEIEAEISGIRLRSAADLARLANLPRRIPAEWERDRLRLRIPAFKLAPQSFLRLARLATLRRLESAGAEREGAAPFDPVTLPAAEAVEAVPVVLADLARPRLRFLSALPRIEIAPVSIRLELLPFRDRGSETQGCLDRVTIQRNLLRYGRNL